MGYIALVSLRRTIERLLNSSQIPFLPPSPEIIQLVKKRVKSVKHLRRNLSRVDSEKREAVIKEIIEATCTLEDTVRESLSYRWEEEKDKKVINSGMEVVQEIRDTLSNPSLWTEELKVDPLRATLQYAFHFVRTLELVFTVEDRSNSEAVKAVKAEIREAAYRLEDVLESAHVSDQYFLSQSQTPDGDDHTSDLADEVGKETLFFIETANKIWEQLDNLPQQPEQDNAAVVLSRTDHIEGKKEKIFGIDHELVQLKDGLLKKTHYPLTVTTIVGMAGIGKTTLVKEIYEDPDIVNHFKCRAFVSIGAEYALKEIKLSILAQMNPEIDEIHLQDEESLDSELLRLCSRRCLIVLDDVWDMSLWNSVGWKFPFKCHGSRIIMTTRLDYCIWPIGCSVLRKRFLNQQESWLLFCDKVFGGDHSSCPPELEKAGRKIIKKCEGLPLTIIAVARHLRSAEKTPEYWKQAKRKVYTTIISEDEATSQVLYRSYHYLRQHLKPCFLYMGVFPHDSDIAASKLIKLWCVEGLLELINPSFNEYNAMDYLYDLLSANVVKVCQCSSSGGIKTCNIYPVFWHICMREAGEQKFFHVIDSNGNQGIESQRRHCIHNNGMFGIKDVRKSMTSTSNVRSILCTGPYHQYPVPICMDFSLLRVLDALTVRFYGFPSEVVKLVHLSYLAFTYNGKLPASISKLCNLEYLIVRQYLSILSSEARRPYLPKEIWDMQGLRHLQVMGSDLPDPNYKGALLPNLSTLSGISARSCTKEILERIPNLIKLGVQMELAPDFDELLCCFEHLASLHKLESLKWSVVNPNLKLLFPAASVLIFPPGLKKLTLSGLGLPWEYNSTIAKLKNLEVLKLQRYAFQGRVWKRGDDRISFPKLRYLLIEDTDLEEWYVSRRFTWLRRLIFRHCYKLKGIPRQIVRIKHLEIELDDCNNPSLLASIEHWQKRDGIRNLRVCAKFSADDGKQVANA
ncbi:putative late blight resistance protein homolog R1A-10 [Sesamum indicum]|uniref:Late blight resistance protein homolog R1A-10 n=1 Tax=Sesamum indicum TaxID=4182 RepID=A0A8M8UYK1_SESIN|nr:putative late blight resistance protein homolog R1A-10 [Sesamum indicum]